MITKVKRNIQRATFVKPNYLECAVQFRKKMPFPTQIHSHKTSREKNYYSTERDVQVSELNKYIRKMERIYDSFPYFPLF